MILPNCIVLGAEKAGTTALYNNLRSHPQVFMAPKEPEFFTFDGTSSPRAKAHDLEGYSRLFTGANEEPVRADVSTSYLPSPHAAERILRYAPNAKLIAILRDPVDRAYSRFWMRLNKRPELLPYTPEKFLEFFESASDSDPLSVRNRGLYSVQLERYFRLFPREQIRVYLYDDYRENGPGVLRDILEFLELDTSFVPPNTTYGAAPLPRSRLLRMMNEPSKWNSQILASLRRVFPRKSVRRLRRFIDRINSAERPKLDARTRRVLIDFYRDDIIKLQDVLDRDLSRWLAT